MTMNRAAILCCILFCIATTVRVQAQNPRLNEYTLGEGLTFSSPNGYNMKLFSYIQPSYEFRSYTDPDFEGNLQRFRLRRFRMRILGDAAEQKIEYRVQFDFSGTPEAGEVDNIGILLDAWVAYNISRRVKIIFGQKASPTDNRELMMSSHALQIVERSRVTSAFATIREFGIFAQGTFRAGRSWYIKPYLTLTNGDGANVFTKDRGGLKAGGRLDFLPFGLFNNFGQFRQADMVRELTPKLVFGVHYSYNNGISSRRGRESGAILYLNGAGEESLPDFMRYGFDFMFKYRGFSVLGEFVGSRATVPDDIVARVRNDGSIATTFPSPDGGEDNVENYVKGRLMLGQGYNIQMGYIFKNLISVDARYDRLVADEFSFLRNGTFYNRPESYTLGITKYMSKGYGFKVQTSITYSVGDPGINDIYGNPITGDEWIARLLTSFAF